MLSLASKFLYKNGNDVWNIVKLSVESHLQKPPFSQLSSKRRKNWTLDSFLSKVYFRSLTTVLLSSKRISLFLNGDCYSRFIFLFSGKFRFLFLMLFYRNYKKLKSNSLFTFQPYHSFRVYQKFKNFNTVVSPSYFTLALMVIIIKF